ncbi:hypothetical protein QQ008_01625 [Fulvivirgaceae bacterium BMA10]|uniref:Cytochrome B n=1 Tax=Splendidivirga corallicola TaxID=3051826 RepID=A0ABT8KH29_9BACT|nr:hypothetical protein [Fulvivirgaceae bacterium BMA10]
MYNSLLFVHSWLRWIILALALIVIIKAFIGWFGNKDYSKGDNALSASFVGTLHLQALIGLILYVFLSPITQSAFQNFGGAMKDAALRYWAVEHILAMLVGVIIAQIGRSRSKKAVEAVKKHKTTAIFYLIALIVILSRVPFNEAGRLFR